MNSLSDYVLLPILYRSSSATFMNKNLRDKSYSMKRWLKTITFGLHVNNYKTLNTLHVSYMGTVEGISPSVLTQLTTLHIGLLGSAWTCLHVCSNLEVLTVASVVDAAFRIPPTVTSLMLPRGTTRHRTMELCSDWLPSSLLKCNIPAVRISPNMKQMVYLREGEVSISSLNLEHLTITEETLHPTAHPILLQCPRLTVLELDTVIGENIQSIISTCTSLTSLTLTYFSGELGLLKGLGRPDRRNSLMTLKVRMSSIMEVDADCLPSSLTRLTLVHNSFTLTNAHLLTRLLVLECGYVAGELPTTLRKLKINNHLWLRIRHIPLTSLSLNVYINANVIDLPDTLTSLKYNIISGGNARLPSHLPPKLRYLCVDDRSDPTYSVPETWSFISLRYVSCNVNMNEKQKEEIKSIGRGYTIEEVD